MAFKAFSVKDALLMAGCLRAIYRCQNRIDKINSYLYSNSFVGGYRDIYERQRDNWELSIQRLNIAYNKLLNS